jgi:hypothetical protein
MYDSEHDMLDAFKAMPATLAFLLEGISQEQALSAKGGDEGWSIVEVVCHLRDAEGFALQRDAMMLEKDNPDIIPFDQAQLAIERHYADQDLHEALEEFIRLRREHITMLELLSAEDWKRPGEHLEMGRITIFGHVLHMVCHDAIHCAQISRQLKAKN